MIKIENKTLLQKGGRFADAFNELGGAKDLDAVSKMTMIKLRRAIRSHFGDLQESFKTLNDIEAKHLIDQSADFDMDQIDASIVMDILTADQIFVLAGNVLTEV